MLDARMPDALAPYLNVLQLCMPSIPSMDLPPARLSQLEVFRLEIFTLVKAQMVFTKQEGSQKVAACLGEALHAAVNLFDSLKSDAVLAATSEEALNQAAADANVHEIVHD